MKNEMWLSMKYLFGRKRGSTLKLMNLLSVSGTATGVMALIVVISVMSGFAQHLQEKILGVTPHITVFRRDGEMQNYKQVREKIMGVKGVEMASPFIVREVMLQGPIKSASAVVKAMDPSDPKVRDFLSGIMAAGGVDMLASPHQRYPGIVLGKWLLQELGCRPGQTLVVISPEGTLTPWGNLPKWKRFRVVGYFDSGYWEFDSRVAYITIQAAQAMFELPDKVTAVEVRLAEPALAPVIRGQLEKEVLGADFIVRDWTQTNRNLIIALGMQKKVLFIVLMCIVGVAALLIASNLIISVMEKRRDIAILKAMGALHSQVLGIFVSQGLVLGALGAALGCAAGVIISLNLVSIVDAIERSLGVQFLPPDVYYISEFATNIETGDVLVIVAATLFISLVSSLFPALGAARMRPVDVLRHE